MNSDLRYGYEIGIKTAIKIIETQMDKYLLERGLFIEVLEKLEMKLENEKNKLSY